MVKEVVKITSKDSSEYSMGVLLCQSQQRSFSCNRSVQSKTCTSPYSLQQKRTNSYVSSVRIHTIPPLSIHLRQRRHCHSEHPNKGSNDIDEKSSAGVLPPNNQTPIAQITPRLHIAFTCGQCKERVQRDFSKHSYEKGVVIITCPGCSNRHLIADNLGWFADVKGRNIEEILAHKGQTVKRIQSAFKFDTLEVDPEDTRKVEEVRKMLLGDENEQNANADSMNSRETLSSRGAENDEKDSNGDTK
eukprot:CFRG6390T1